MRNLEKLQEENQELKMMMRKLCHEMGNALTLLGGSIFYLENELRAMDSQDKVDSLKGDYNYMCGLFADLRDYNHCQSGDKQSIGLWELAGCGRAIFEKLRDDMVSPDEHIDFQCSYKADASEAYIQADMVKLRQVLINIIKNSIEAMIDGETGGRKSITMSLSVEQEMGIDTEDVRDQYGDNDVAHIQISDTGKGIAPQYIDDIFKPMCSFQKEQGVGLGLAVVRKIIEDHQGKIKAVSAPGTGTAIHIYLPVSMKGL